MEIEEKGSKKGKKGYVVKYQNEYILDFRKKNCLIYISSISVLSYPFKRKDKLRRNPYPIPYLVNFDVLDSIASSR